MEDLRRRRFVYSLGFLARRDFSGRYAPTVLGFGWTLLHPLLLLLLYTTVFGLFLDIRFQPGDRTADFVLRLLAGLLPHLAVVEGVQRAATSLHENRHLLDKAVFPAAVLPMVGVVSGLVTEVVTLTLLVLFAAGFDVVLSWWLLCLPILVLLRVIFTVGLAWLVSVLNVLVADLGQALGLVFTAWFFLTPIVYPPSSYPDWLAGWAKINPLYHMVEGYRAVILDAAAPGAHLLALGAWGALSALVGLVVFRRTIETAKDFL